MKRNPQPPTNRAADCYELLQVLLRQQMPVVYSEREDIHKILALRSACLLEALTEPSETLRSGERRIARAIVTSVTPEGRAACLTYSAISARSKAQTSAGRR